MKFAQPAWYNVLDTNADAQDVADATVAFARTAAKLGGQPGVIYVPAGNYTLSGSLPSLVQGQSIIGDGSAATFVNYTGNGTLLSAGITGAFAGSAYAGKIQGLYLSGYSAGASAVGVQLEDAQGYTVDDLAVYGFGGKGIFFTSGTGYSEEATVRARVVQCGTYGTASSGAVVFDSTSFDYGNYDFTIITLPGTHGVVLQNAAQLRGVSLRVRGNFYARSSANTGAVIAIDPAGGSGTSYLTDAQVDVAVESAGTGGQVGHTLVLMGSSNSVSQFTGQGVLSFNPFGPATIYSQGLSNANFVPFGFSGYLQDGTSTGTVAAGDAIVLHGGTEIAPNGSLSGLPGGSNQVYTQFGDVIEFKLASGANVLGINGTTGYVRKVDLWIAQPGTGAAGTITWPSVKWPAGTPPTLSSVNGYVDHVRLTYLPDTAAWYGELIGVHYS